MVGVFRNIVRLKVVAKALSTLTNKIVFVGGAVVDLYADDPSRGESRPTDDIDVVIEVFSATSYAQIEELLRKIGFKNDIMSGIICRFQFHDIIVDIMPDDISALGFTNKWYKSGIENRFLFQLDEQISIPIFPVSYFIASKLEALKSRRHGSDYRFNSDFEDIIYIFDNRTTVLEDMITVSQALKTYFKAEFTELLARSFIVEEISANLDYSTHQFRLNRILAIFKKLTE